MGTRSTTKIYEDGQLILALYKQFDGYIENGWGDDLKQFIKSKRFVNGLVLGNYGTVFNGIGDFALQLVNKFKLGAGDLYATFETDHQEYNYEIRFSSKTGILELVCLEEKRYNEKIDTGWEIL